MSCFYIFNPHISSMSSNVVKFNIRYGDTDQIALGTDDFIQELLSDLQISTNVVSWSLKPSRTSYYSNYWLYDDWNSENWEDKWELIWQAVVTSDKPIKSIVNHHFGIGTNAYDDSWSYPVQKIVTEKVNCVVISDFVSERALEEAIKLITTNLEIKEKQESQLAPLPTFCYYKLLDRYFHLEINLGQFTDNFFAKGADYAEVVSKVCEMTNGTVHITSLKEY